MKKNEETAETISKETAVSNSLMTDTPVAEVPPTFEVGVFYPEFPISQLKPNPNQPRSNNGFDDAELRALTASIVKVGIIQPIIAMLEENKTEAMIMAVNRL
jgi:hypothetical protein